MKTAVVIVAHRRIPLSPSFNRCVSGAAARRFAAAAVADLEDV